jgi:hypothetical protein
MPPEYMPPPLAITPALEPEFDWCASLAALLAIVGALLWLGVTIKPPGNEIDSCGLVD